MPSRARKRGGTEAVCRGRVARGHAVGCGGSSAGRRAAGHRRSGDNQAGLALQVDAAGPDGGRLGLGLARPQATTTFHEVADRGGNWTFMFSYGGREVFRQAIGARELAGRGWTVQVPSEVTMELERQGYQ